MGMGVGGMFLCFLTVSVILLWGFSALLLREEYKELNDEQEDKNDLR